MIIIGVTEVRITIAKKYLQNQTISLLTSHQQLADAPKQAAAALEKQSPMYNQMQQATEALKFPAQKMKEAMDAITKEAAAFHQNKETVAKMRELKEKELEPDGIKKPEAKQANNTAIEKGTVAYFDTSTKTEFLSVFGITS